MSNLLNAFYNSQNQIIDVTKECTFEWYQEPLSCYAFLEVSNASGNFTDGETVTGGTSNATATVFSSYVGGGRVYVENVSGTFQAGETITGNSSNQTATVDGFVAERSYPDNVIHGTFPDSIISKDIDDYLEWESTLTGSGFIGQLTIIPSSDGWYFIPLIVGFGEDINGINTARYFYFRARDRGDTKMAVCDPGFFNGVSPSSSSGALGPIYLFTDYDGQYPDKNKVFLGPYQNNKGTFRWRIHNIRVLKLVI